MKTKRIVLLAVIVTILTNIQVIARNVNQDKSNKELKRNELLDRRCHRMEAQLVLDEKTAAKFTPLYKEYLNSLSECHQENCRLGKNNQTDADRLARMEQNFETRQMVLDIQKKYYNEFKRILNARQLETLFCSHHKQNARRNYYKDDKHHANCHSRSAQKRQADCRH